MSTFEDIWQKLSKSKKYREEYALSLLKKMVPFQIRTIRKKQELSQPELAEKSHLTQGVISRAENLDYGNLTLNTIGRIAGGFDLAFIGRFVPFSELARFAREMSESEFAAIPTFEQETSLREQMREHLARINATVQARTVVAGERFAEVQQTLSNGGTAPELGTMPLSGSTNALSGAIQIPLPLEPTGSYCRLGVQRGIHLVESGRRPTRRLSKRYSSTRKRYA
ncbi:MAG TPA: helix-turn-helix transcriptional regulator [Terriglobales bacterium]|jgi:transcriptional regulator with XRE-family HTH domain